LSAVRWSVAVSVWQPCQTGLPLPLRLRLALAGDRLRVGPVPAAPRGLVGRLVAVQPWVVLPDGPLESECHDGALLSRVFGMGTGAGRSVLADGAARPGALWSATPAVRQDREEQHGHEQEAARGQAPVAARLVVHLADLVTSRRRQPSMGGLPVQQLLVLGVRAT